MTAFSSAPRQASGAPKGGGVELTYMYIQIFLYIHIHVYIYIYTCMYLHTGVHIHVDIQIQNVLVERIGTQTQMTGFIIGLEQLRGNRKRYGPGDHTSCKHSLQTCRTGTVKLQ